MDILNLLWETSVYSGVIFAAIMLFKKCLGSKLSPLLHYAVWALLILRLVMPFTLESPVHLFTTPSAAAEDALIQREPGAQPQGNRETANNAAITEAQQPQTAPRAQPVRLSPLAPAAAKPLAVQEIALAVWIIGMSVSLVYLLTSVCLLQKRIRRNAARPSAKLLALFEQAKASMGLKVKIKLVCQYEYGAPALMFPATVLMPVDVLTAMNERQIRYAFRHELTHFIRGDQMISILLSILKVVYWFNPVVWLAAGFIRADMEAACDSAVVRAMSRDERADYASLILQLFARVGHKQIVLSLARRGTKIMAERRIRSVFMNGNSKMGARLLCVFLTAVLAVGCFTTACQPAQSPAVIDAAADNPVARMENTIPVSHNIPQPHVPSNDALYARLGAPKRWETQTASEDGKLNIIADAAVTLPGVAELPVASAVLREFTQADIDHVAQVLLGNGLSWYENILWTKEDAEYALGIDRAYLAQLEAEGKTDDIMIENTKNAISALEQECVSAPSEKDAQQTDLTIRALRDGSMSYRGVSAHTLANGQNYTFDAGSPYWNETQLIHVSASDGMRGAYFAGTYLDVPYGVKLTREQAAGQAASIAAQLTDELALCYIAPTAAFANETSRNWGWACVFMRKINGCGSAYATEDVGASMESEEQNPIRYEKMVIVLDDGGLIAFTWENPMTVTNISDKNAALLPFGEVSARALPQIRAFYKYDVENDPGATASVTRVELGIMRVGKPNEYTYLPVWHFFSNIEHTEAYKQKYYKDDDESPRDWVDKDGNPYTLVTGYPDAWGSVTINAIDGSIIDKDLGY